MKFREVFLSACVLLMFSAPCMSQTSAPFAGNGMRNGWADQNSIVIWTRTTEKPDMVSDGPDFKQVNQKLDREIKKQGDDSKYLTSQLADGHQLHQMLGACPGAAGQARLKYWPQGSDRAQAKTTSWITTTATSDFTAQWKLENLASGTSYQVVVEMSPIENTTPTPRCQGYFSTALPEASDDAFKFCITTCHDFLRRDDGEKGHLIYPSMTKINPSFVVHAGDIEYYDKAKPYAWTKELMRFKWQRLFSMPRNRTFYSNHTSYFIKDDHDTLKNDSWPGQTYGNVTFDQGVQLFNEEQFPSHPTRYKTIRWGKDLQMWILEGRDYRSSHKDPDGPEKSILGSKQKAWLKKTLKESKARFKLIMSPTPIVGPDRKNKSDNHANPIFAREGKELRHYFATIEGLIVFCGDRHWQYASVDSETGVWEFGCGPGSKKHQLGWKQGDVRDSHRFLRVAGGFLSGEIVNNQQSGVNELILRHHSVDGKKKSEFVFVGPSAWGIDRMQQAQLDH